MTYAIPYTDAEAWEMFPRDRWVYNKLLLAEKLGYPCGPAGIDPPEVGEWFVKPIYNLNGMGVGAHRQYTDHHGSLKIPPGTFWSPVFNGARRSIDAFWDENIGEWVSTLIVEPKNRLNGLVDRWVKIQPAGGRGLLQHLPFHLADCRHINIETIGPHIIEVHLRWNPDFRLIPDRFNEAVVVWEGEEAPVGYWVPAEDDADGFLPIKRRGFVYR